MSANKELGKFEYGGKKVLLEDTPDGYKVTLDSIDLPLDKPTIVYRFDLALARRIFEQAIRRAIPTVTTEMVLNQRFEETL